ncbi:hypothetical protein L873DRAFT_1732030, partial [Choiromyces venosus 120613-1]
MMTPLLFSPQEFHQPTLPYSRTYPPHRFYNLLNSKKKEKMSQSFFNQNSNSFNNNSFNNVVNLNNFAADDEKSEILAWLSPLEPQMRHHDIRTRRVEAVGDWLLQTEEYRNWFDGIHEGESENSVLFCHGDPGVGKTYTSSLVIDRLCDWARGRNATVACFYFDYAAQKEQTPTSMMGSILKQIVRGLDEVPKKLVEAFRDQKKVIGGRRLENAQIVEMLQDISSSRRTFICIDALDECVVEYRTQMLDSLRRILQRSPGTRIFLTGRSHVRSEIEKQLAGRVAAVSVTPTRDDIIRFLRAKLNEDTIPDAMDKSLEDDIIKNISETTQRFFANKYISRFLLVSLNIGMILQETTIYRRREKLRTMIVGLSLGDAYDATIRRIKAQGGDRERLGMAALLWISHSERPLKVDEICHALAVEIGSMDLDANNVPSIRTLLNCCQGLIAVDKEASTVRLIHFTLKEYLSNHVDLLERAHSIMAETCLTYLNFQAIKALSVNSFLDLQNTPFLEYSSLYWGIHARKELSNRAKSLVLNLLDHYENHISTKLLWESISRSRNPYPYVGQPFPGLHCISYFGIVEIAIVMMKQKRWDVNQTDGKGMTPLMWAARCGHEEVAGALLQLKDTKPDMPGTYDGRTALSWAAGSGHEGVVALFL